jgi:hypothetical protein
MSRPPRWEIGATSDGVQHVRLSSWKYFHDFVRQKFLDFPHYVWRGQRDAAWPLESSLDRALRVVPTAKRRAAVKKHLSCFKLASRGRRGANPAKIADDDEWWAIAQDSGMATPLLDWTEAPFVALYFSFFKDQRPPAGERAVWALGGGSINKKNAEIRAAHSGPTPAPTLDFIRPQQDENSRLVAQSGLFTKVPFQTTVDDWIVKNFNGKTDSILLLKITMPSTDRPECLRTLNRMNINHLSLFPDLYGAATHCNNKLQILHY